MSFNKIVICLFLLIPQIIYAERENCQSLAVVDWNGYHFGEEMQNVIEDIKSYGPLNLNIVLTGETGTGKGVIARLIHEISTRRGRPFVSVNLGQIPVTVAESELFGHARGSFTGADRDKPGLFDAADKGTIFLDEIHTLSLEGQRKLLAVLDGDGGKRVFRGLGRNERHVNVRVIAASTQSLEKLVEEKQFLADLYYRLLEGSIRVPALRERPSDIVPLAQSFLLKYGAEYGKLAHAFTPEAEAALMNQPWAGNIRELLNVVKRSVAKSRSTILDVGDLIFAPSLLTESPSTDLNILDLFNTSSITGLEEFIVNAEETIIKQALRSNNGNISRTAESLHIKRTTLSAKMRRSRMREAEQYSAQMQ